MVGGLQGKPSLQMVAIPRDKFYTFTNHNESLNFFGGSFLIIDEQEI